MGGRNTQGRWIRHDRHRLERDAQKQMIRLESGCRQGEAIPNLVAAKSIADSGDDYSDVGFCWQRWEEASGRVTVEFRRWTCPGWTSPGRS